MGGFYYLLERAKHEEFEAWRVSQFGQSNLDSNLPMKQMKSNRIKVKEIHFFPTPQMSDSWVI
jgi:hypothetical protein